ncbi:Uncharacterised protein [Chlamydia trachomatis]|nr:Uncharacterised protein [Chlamydia trachomatis]
MLKVKEFINKNYSIYLLVLILLYILALFIPWDIEIYGIILYPFVTQKLFLIIGVINALLAFITKRAILFILSIIFFFAFWINFLIFFGVFPLFLGN